MKKTHLTKPEYALLTVAVAQKLAGPNGTPTAAQVSKAERESKDAILRRGLAVKGGTASADRLFAKVREDLSGISGIGGDEVGSLWDKIKAVVSTAAPIAPFVSPSASLAVPIAKAVAAQHAKKAAASAATLLTKEEESDDGLQKISGDAFKDASDSLIYGEPIADAYHDAEDTLLFGEGAGRSEQRAARRFGGRRSSAMGGVTPVVYRMAVMQRASKLGGKRPSTRDIFTAQQSVDRDMKRAGVGFFMPGATPGRVTR